MGRAVLQQGGDGLDFGVVLQYLVPHLAASAGLLVSAEWQRRVEQTRCSSLIQTLPALIFLASAWASEMSLVQMLAPKAVRGVVGGGSYLVQVAERRCDYPGPEIS
jgi:hypothetical protein